ncbi:MAG: ABC transporter substrate binding protein [Thermodesulfobacteriota bacterium]
MELWVGAITLGFLYAFMTIGIFITFRVFDFPDITVDGSFTTGAAAAAVLITAGVHPIPAVAAGFCFGAAAGTVTALIHTRLNVNGLLAGILVMTGLYSINLHVMGRSNIPLLNQTTLFTHLESLNPGMASEIWLCLCLAVVMALLWAGVSLFFRTDLGITMRITGNNPTMAGANGVNAGLMKTLGIALANGFVGVSGALVAQYQGFADIGMGIGTVVIGLASVIIGEAVLKRRSIYARILSVFIGSVIFRFMIAFALFVGMNPVDMKLLTALFVLLTLVASRTVSGKKDLKGLVGLLDKMVTGRRKIVLGLGAAVVVLVAGLLGTRYMGQGPAGTSRIFKTCMIGKDGSRIDMELKFRDEAARTTAAPAPKKEKRLAFFTFSDSDPLMETAEGIMDELRESGILEKHGIRVDRMSAQNEFSIAQGIVQDIVHKGYDYIITISTLALQATANGNKRIPHVFGAVTDPYRMGIARNPEDHIPNITGVATLQPVEATIQAMRELFPRARRIGMVWNPGEACSEACTYKARDAAKRYGFELLESNVSSTGEVLDAVRALVKNGIDVFFTSGDNTVILAYQSIAEVLRESRIPYFTNTPSDVEKGAFVSIGADYYEVGRETARHARLVIEGKDPKAIPIKDFVPETIGINLKLAEVYGIQVPEEFLSRAKKVRR